MPKEISNPRTNLKELSDSLNERIITRDVKRQKNIENGNDNLVIIAHLSLNRLRWSTIKDNNFETKLK